MEAAQSPHFFWKYQTHARRFYHAKPIELLVAGLIVFNFLVGCTQAQIDPNKDRHKILWDIFEDFFNIIFLMELALNMYGSWMRPFFGSSWNIFDLIVVSIGLLDLCRAPLPGPLKLVRLLRAFRVFRLFGRVESLGKTLQMIEHAVPGVLSAFLIAIIMLCIYAVLATDFFKELYTDCMDSDDPVAITARGKCFGKDYYGNFLKSLYTLFQILTGESWSEAAVRPVFQFYEDSPFEVAGSALFFLSFIMINSIVILNVVVAFLINGMYAPEPEDESKAKESIGLLSADDLRDLSSEVTAVRQKFDSHRTECQRLMNMILTKIEAENQSDQAQAAPNTREL